MAILNPPFDDSQQRPRACSTSNQSTDARPFDAYRQGVELTLRRHYGLGVAKIHSGYTEQDGAHTAPQTTFGQSQKAPLTDERYHRDVVATNPAAYAARTSSAVAVVVDAGTLDVDVRLFDGVLEPLDIRDAAARKAPSKRPGHQVCGALEEGNVRTRDRSDVFASKAKFRDVSVGSSPMVDNVNGMGDMPTPGASLSVDARLRGPFKEDQPARGVITSPTIGDDMLAALSSMSPSTVNVLPNDFVQLGSNGFDN